jgi:ASC-1-like (ASCH) protein
MAQRLMKLLSATAFLLMLFICSCSVNYSFTGAVVNQKAKTIQIAYFQNNAPLVNPTLSQQFTDALRDKFQSQTNLIIVNQGGDMSIEGQIIDYNTRPTAIQSGDIAAFNRLTISVKVTFINKVDETQSFIDQTFTRYDDYPSSADLNTVQETLVKTINDYLIEDIFNKAVVNW